MFSAIRIFLLTVLLAGAGTTLYAQRPLTGIVHDAQGTAVPFAVVELPAHHLGVQANQDGYFSLPLPTGLTSTDSLAVSALGFQRLRLPVPATAATRLQLQALPVSLAGVTVHATAIAPQWLGPEEDTERFGFSQNGLSPEKNTGWQVARYFQPAAAGYLTGARFFVNGNGSGNCDKKLLKTPFRIRVYTADGPNGGPGTDLLTASVLASAAKAGWVTVDLRPYNLAFPAQGVFVAMEWVYTSDQFLCSYQYTQLPTKEKKTGTRYGQSLGGRLTPETQTWYYTITYGWRKFQTRDQTGQQRIGDAAIQAQYMP
ncbi:hypothetical protein ACFPAF_05825 [Hymenobacter endophyticus]|uniref:Carboxypeptidase-like regulatory domain-containing protein n=1 Tax=Hymenobacter endophyticus TaxID=3076335 RepID=A0ABU3TEZ0_9BACT|nr:hypothetical protein [Hymenobacter endophyticus]MDU0369905.1 hypothetical protein [Hymenobacter endophyticus]